MCDCGASSRATAERNARDRGFLATNPSDTDHRIRSGIRNLRNMIGRGTLPALVRTRAECKKADGRSRSSPKGSGAQRAKSSAATKKGRGRGNVSDPIRAYRALLSPLLPRMCRFHPSCSVYALQALEEHGPVKGLWLAVRRLSRCHPFHPGGLDPVPPRS